MRSGVAGAALAGVVVALLGLAVAADVLVAQGVVASAHAEIAVGAAGTATVRVRYRMEGVEPGAEVPVELLGVRDTPPLELRDADGSVLALRTISGTRSETVVVVGARSEVTLEYSVPGAVRSDGSTARVLLPLPTVSLPPETGTDDVFSVELRLPGEWVVTESVPSGLRRDADGVYATSIPVVPALVSVWVRTDGRWRPGLGLTLELLGAAILLVFAVAGRRHLARAAS